MDQPAWRGSLAKKLKDYSKSIFMAEKRYNEEGLRQDNQEAHPKPDRETLGKTDPQKHMEGPVSSSMKKTGHVFDTDETKEEADSKKDRNL